MSSQNSFRSRDTLTVDGRAYIYYKLDAVAGLPGATVAQLPFSLRILLENLLRNEDGGFVKKEDITHVSEPNGQTTVYAPVPTPRKKDVDPHQPRKGDSPAVAAWRERMATEAAKAIYKERASTAETANNHSAVPLLASALQWGRGLSTAETMKALS